MGYVKITWGLVLLICTALLVIACGGSGGDGSTATVKTPYL